MKLLTLQEVELRRGDQLYRESSVIPFFVSLISFGIAVWILFLYSNGDAPLFITIVSGGGLILFSFLCFHIFKKSFSANNWYVAVKPVGTLLIKFRSHLNELLPASDKQVVLLPFSEIDSVGITKQTEKSDSADGTKVQYFTFFDIHTNCNNIEELAERLNYEIHVKAKTKYHDYPVSLQNKTIRIQWRSAKIRMTPGIKNLLTTLKKQGITVLPINREKIDLRAKTVKNKNNTEADIIKLVQQGDKIGAVRLTKELYDFDLTAAKKFVDQLDGSTPDK